jgi:hypothetical protein
MAEESPVSDVAAKNPPRGTNPRKRQAIARPTQPDHAGAAAEAMSGLKNIPNVSMRHLPLLSLRVFRNRSRDKNGLNSGADVSKLLSNHSD